MSIEVANSLTVGLTNTPLDARTRVAAFADIANVESPYLGMLIYCVANGLTYRVVTLKSKTIGVLTVANAAIEAVEVFGGVKTVAGKSPSAAGNIALTASDVGAAGEDHSHDALHTHANAEALAKIGENASGMTYNGEAIGGGGTAITRFQLTRPEGDQGMHLLIWARPSGSLAVGSTDIVLSTMTNPEDRAKVKAWTGTEFVECPEDGFGTPFERQVVIVDLTGVPQPTYLFYQWQTVDHTESDWYVSAFPVATEHDAMTGSTAATENAAWNVLTYAASITLTRAGGENQTVVLSGDIAITSPTLSGGERLLLEIDCGDTARTVTVDSATVLSGVTGVHLVGWYNGGAGTRRFAPVEVV